MFAEAPPLSTYLFALVAGPYLKFEDIYTRSSTGKDGESQEENVPLGIYCRRAMAPYLDKSEQDRLFEITKQGLAFYADFFNYPYPFGKYDQLFVPEVSIQYSIV